MGIDIGLTGRFTSRVHRGGAAAAEAIQRFAQEWWGEDLLESDLVVEGSVGNLYLLTHPTAQPIEVVMRRGTIEAEARTNTVGPGYHERICSFFHHMEGVAGIEWEDDPDQDETGFFTSGNREELEQAMFDWLSGLCRSCLKHFHEPDEDSSMGLCMPMEPRFLLRAAVQTPLGPRTIEWLRAVADDPSGEAGRSFFCSWREERSATELLNRALSHMWMDLYWVSPQSEASERALDRVADLLAEAYRSDPTLAYPWAEWAEVLRCAEREDDALAPVVFQQAEGRVPSIGYRRHPVAFGTVPGGWSITLPGRFEEGADDDGGWFATDGEDLVEVTTYTAGNATVAPDPLEILRSDLPDAPVFDQWRDDQSHSAAVVHSVVQDDEEINVVSAWRVEGVHLAGISISTRNDPHQRWIAEALRSARAPAGE